MVSQPNWLHGLLLLSAAVLTGCSQDSAKPIENSGTSTKSTPAARPPQASRPPAPQRSPITEAPVTISEPVQNIGLNKEDATAIVYEPVVALSAQHEETCHVTVNAPFPSFEAKTLDGQAILAESEFGPQVTVVVFWNLQYPMAIEQMSRINEEVVERFRDAKVKVLAINVGDTAEDVRNFLTAVPCDAVCLLDEESKAFGQLATGILPRTYLLNSNGVVRWLDLEYSRSTRRELRNAIIFNLRMQLAAAPDFM